MAAEEPPHVHHATRPRCLGGSSRRYHLRSATASTRLNCGSCVQPERTFPTLRRWRNMSESEQDTCSTRSRNAGAGAASCCAAPLRLLAGVTSPWQSAPRSSLPVRGHSPQRSHPHVPDKQPDLAVVFDAHVAVFAQPQPWVESNPRPRRHPLLRPSLPEEGTRQAGPSDAGREQLPVRLLTKVQDKRSKCLDPPNPKLSSRLLGFLGMEHLAGIDPLNRARRRRRDSTHRRRLRDVRPPSYTAAISRPPTGAR